MDPFATVNTQMCLLDGRMIWPLQFRRWPFQNLYNNLNNLLILLQPKNLSTTLDIRHWKLNQSGIFIVNSLYRSLTRYHKESNYFWWIWTIQVSLKFKVHMWISFHEWQTILLKEIFTSPHCACFVGLIRKPSTICSFIILLLGTLGTRTRSLSIILVVIFYCISLKWSKAFQYLVM